MLQSEPEKRKRRRTRRIRYAEPLVQPQPAAITCAVPQELSGDMKDFKKRRNPRAGVTLIEMLVVVVIIAVFAAVVGPRLLNQGDKARVVAAKQQIENYQLALGQYHLDTGGY